MFKVRDTGFPALAPLLPHYTPCRPQHPMKWQPHKGDLQDMRNRLGHLVPAELRYVEVELVREPLERCRISPIMIYLQEITNQRLHAKGSLYRDPYKRDTLEGPDRVEAFRVPVPDDKWFYDPYAAKWTGRRERMEAHRGQTTSKQLKLLSKTSEPPEDYQTAMREFWNLGPGRKPGHTSERLYQPKQVKIISEWAKNFDLTKAANRRKDLDQLLINKCQDHGRHGEIVRLKKQDRDTEATALMMAKIKQKEDRNSARARKERDGLQQENNNSENVTGQPAGT